MNKPKFLSPSALEIWLKSREEYFLKYLATDKPPKFLQTEPMAVGSSFDAFIKSFLHQNLFGKNHKDSAQFEFDTIFNLQVESQNKDFAIKAGASCFEQYKTCGALESLLVILQRPEVTSTVKMEFSEQGTIQEHGVSKSINDSVVVLGKPDLFFRLDQINIVFDFKVNGFKSASGVNPAQGYVKYLEPGNKKHGSAHKEAFLHYENGIEFSLTPNVELYQPSWGRQLAAYSWICGASVGSEIVVAVDQLCCRPSYPSPIVGVAQHRCVLSKAFQLKTLEQFQKAWDQLQSGHIFEDMSLEENNKHIELLSQRAMAYSGDTVEDQWLKRLRTERKL